MGQVASPSETNGGLAVGKGLLLAAANVLVIAVGLTVASGNGAMLVLALMVGSAPGLVASGVLFGLLAEALATQSPRWRIALLALPPLGLVAAVGSLLGFRFLALVPFVCIPTLVSALVLERWTRRAVPAAVPVATARGLRTSAARSPSTCRPAR